MILREQKETKNELPLTLVLVAQLLSLENSNFFYKTAKVRTQIRLFKRWQIFSRNF